ncbi:hypothetical protein [Quadrisphaera sp. KR29]|uniref:hypothetical protein n=1 Tax=Quadrisphaera sp. KR29 TaxID=3461391 RepID=UPI004043FFEE
MSYDVLLFLPPEQPERWSGAVEQHLRELQERPAEPGLVLDDCLEQIATRLPETAWAGPARDSTTETAALLSLAPGVAATAREVLVELAGGLRPFVAYDLQVEDFLLP